MEWLDDDNIVGERLDPHRGITYEESFVYKDIPYKLVICYQDEPEPHQLPKGIIIQNKWCVLEPTEESLQIMLFVKDKRPSRLEDFLWRDTMTSHPTKKTLKQQVEYMHAMARSDIDRMFNLEIMVDEKFQSIIRKLQEGNRA